MRDNEVQWTLTCPARQGVIAGFRLLVVSLWAFLRRQDVSFEYGFEQIRKAK